MTISPEAKEATNRLLNFIGDIELPFGTSLESDVAIQLAINSATAPAVQSAKDSAANFRKSEVKRIEAEREVTNLQKEIERLRGEIEKAVEVLTEIAQEHHTTFREIGDIGYSDGLYLKPDLFKKVKSVLDNSRAKRVAEGKE